LLHPRGAKEKRYRRVQRNLARAKISTIKETTQKRKRSSGDKLVRIGKEESSASRSP